jgi:methoxymalonate biosynthesis protein
MGGLVKCMVWDLDNTLWQGTLAEGDECRLRPGIAEALAGLDGRGILLSIASANDAAPALAQLRRFGVEEYFLSPQIGWGGKVASILRIAEELGIALDAIGFIDDEPFEREQVRQLLPDVRTYDARDAAALLDRPECDPGPVTPEASRRRQMVVQGWRRAQAEQEEGHSHREFLRSCQTRLGLRRAAPEDAPRILELLQRTHQLNATGVVYSPQELNTFCDDPRHRVYVATLTDRFADYGRIGVAICRCEPEAWTILCFLLSCRVLRRGIGNVILAWVRNRPMRILYTMAGFEPTEPALDGIEILSRPCRARATVPDWLTLIEEGQA